MAVKANIAILIPAYNPEDSLLDLVSSLIDNGVEVITVVNDGSDQNCTHIFKELAGMKNCQVLHHAVNMGKGAALKTGLNYIYCSYNDVTGVVTADADGQHLAKDILNTVAALEQNSENKLVLGVRHFGRSIPLRSLIGNLLTRYLFRFFSRLKISDTQTGLRGIPRDFITKILKINANGYELELEMLLMTKRVGLSVLEVPIETVYLDNNKSSHFNPLVDSMKIYFVFIRFISSSLLAALIDYIVFIFSYSITGNIFTSLCVARPAAVVVNFFINKNFVFHSHESIKKTSLMYLMVVVAHTLISYGFIKFLVGFFPINVIAAKIITESILYIANFAVQRDFIFGREMKK